MSSSCRILIGQYEILSRKERVIPDIMPIFREHDRKAYSHTDEDNEVWPVYEYSNTVGHIIQRLNVLGYSLKNIKGDFDANRANIIQELRIDEEEDPDFFKERNAIIIKVLEESSLEDWIEAFRVIRERNLSIIPCWSDREPEKTQSPLVKYVLTEEDYGTFCNFPGGDLLAIFRLFLETCPVETIVKLDISDLIGGGWYGEDQAVCEETLNGLKAGY